MKPSYTPNVFDPKEISTLLTEVSWLAVTEARQECFMASEEHHYTYGSGRGIRTYQSVPYHALVQKIQDQLNTMPDTHFNVCFLNRYGNEKQHLGWHADDSPGMLHSHPIAVVSFGAPREIWWREHGQVGVIPQEQRRLLEPGSLFIMPPKFQEHYQHRIPKSARPCGERVSLTFRRFIPV